LALTAARVASPGWWRVAVFVSVLALASTQPVRLWDGSVLSETTALSFLALLVGTLLSVVRKFTWPRVAAVALSALGFAATRDTSILTVLALAVAVLCAASWPSSARRGALALGGAMLVAGALPLTLLAVSGRSDVNVRDNYYVRVFPYSARVAWFAGHGMPEAPRIKALAAANRPEPGQMPVVAPDPQDPVFTPLYTWISSADGADVYLEWLAVHPTYLFTAPFHQPPETFNNAGGHLSYYAGNSASTRALDRIFAGPWWYAVGIATLAVALASLGGVTRRREWQLAALLAVVGAASVVAAWQGDGQEVTRHTVEADVQVRLALLLALLIALPDWWLRYVRRLPCAVDQSARSGAAVKLAAAREYQVEVKCNQTPDEDDS